MLHGSLQTVVEDILQSRYSLLWANATESATEQYFINETSNSKIRCNVYSTESLKAEMRVLLVRMIIFIMAFCNKYFCLIYIYSRISVSYGTLYSLQTPLTLTNLQEGPAQPHVARCS